MPLKIFNGEKTAVDLKCNDFEIYTQFCAVFLKDEDTHPVNTYKNIIKKYKEYLKTNGIELRKLSELQKGGVAVSVENARLLAEYPDFLSEMISDGVSVISLSWNGENPLCGGALSDGKLTFKGEEIIKKINDLGAVLDISHLNEKSSLSALNVAKKVVATHSNCSSVFYHKRNLSDSVLLKIAKKHGLVGVCFYPEFLGAGNVFLNIEKQINHLILLGMEDNISFGSDFDGAEMDDNLNSTSKIPFLYRYLKIRGMEEKLLNKIFFENAISFFKRI